MSRMNILHVVESYLPARHGMSEVVSQISERLAARGHLVTVATGDDPEREEHLLRNVRVEPFQISGNEATGYRAALSEIDRYRSFLHDSQFDIVTLFAAQHWATDLAFPLLPSLSAKVVFVPTGFSGLMQPRYRKYFEAMPQRMRQMNANVFLSDTYRDAVFARRNKVHNGVLIPNGASETEFCDQGPTDLRQTFGIPEDHLLILHVGRVSGLKGHEEAIDIFRRSGLSRATLLLCSEDFASEVRREPRRSIISQLKSTVRNLFAEPLMGPSAIREFADVVNAEREASQAVIRLASPTRQQTVAAYQAADIFLFPSRIECSPIVLFEALASRTPFLATDVGNAVEIAAWSGAGVIMPTRKDAAGLSWAVAEPAARLLRELAEDPTSRQRMASDGWRAWQQRFTWDRIATEYESLYGRLLQSDNAERSTAQGT